MTTTGADTVARRIDVRGVVQGVGFRPYVWRLAHAHALRGWVRNDGDGVRIQIEGDAASVDSFIKALQTHPPAAAQITAIDIVNGRAEFAAGFDILDSRCSSGPTARISPDLPICELCLRELRHTADRRSRYPYVNCTNCGPRYSILL
ncbi:MAG TPA: acylphosphatase, partial [Vicinamibacterales bacterium]|nr:acylphosphatase [Vicinamibacterales bacterium]